MGSQPSEGCDDGHNKGDIRPTPDVFRGSAGTREASTSRSRPARAATSHHSRSARKRSRRGATKPEWLPGSSIGSLSQ